MKETNTITTPTTVEAPVARRVVIDGAFNDALRKPPPNFARPGTQGTWARDIPSNINNYGIQRDNLGIVICPVAKILRDRWNQNDENLLAVTRRSESFNIPGKTIQTSEVRRYGIGATSRVPVGSVNPPTFTINFVADQTGLYYQFWIVWMDGIVRTQGRSSSSMSTPNNWGTYFYEVEYFNNYTVDITLLELDPKYNEIVETKLVNAYPIGIQDHVINWGNSGFVTFNVEFAVEAVDVKINKLSSGGKLPPMPEASGSSLAANLIQSGNAVDAAGIIGGGVQQLASAGGVRR